MPVEEFMVEPEAGGIQVAQVNMCVNIGGLATVEVAFYLCLQRSRGVSGGNGQLQVVLHPRAVQLDVFVAVVLIGKLTDIHFPFDLWHLCIGKVAVACGRERYARR